jgi:hypothetical protein
MLQYDIRSRNCQDFVEDCMEALEIEANMRGQVQQFIKTLTGGDVDETKFRFKDKEFTSHRDLDTWYDANKGQLTDEEKVMIKAFDRAYWLRWRSCKDALDGDEDILALMDESKPHGGVAACKCPFDDPEKTVTFVPRG